MGNRQCKRKNLAKYFLLAEITFLDIIILAINLDKVLICNFFICLLVLIFLLWFTFRIFFARFSLDVSSVTLWSQ